MQQQEQQQPIYNEVATGISKVVAKWECQSGTRDGTRDVRCYRTDTGSSSGKPVQDPESKVEQKPDVDIDVRVQGVSQDAILQDEAKMREINQQLNKVKAGSNKISIRNDLAKNGMIFSEASSRAVYEMDNVELIELKQTSESMQYLSCLKHVFEGTTICQCGKLLRPNKSMLDRIRAAFEAIALHQSFREERNVVIIPGNTTIINRWQNDEVYRASQLAHNWNDEWVKYLDFIAHLDISHDTFSSAESTIQQHDPLAKPRL